MRSFTICNLLFTKYYFDDEEDEMGGKRNIEYRYVKRILENKQKCNNIDAF
jgi:hypothetical protein